MVGPDNACAATVHTLHSSALRRTRGRSWVRSFIDRQECGGTILLSSIVIATVPGLMEGHVVAGLYLDPPAAFVIFGRSWD
jgi:hypothetical protein